MKAKKLKKENGYIGVCCPSSAISLENELEMEIAKKKINELGYEVRYSKNMLDKSFGFNGNPKLKAEDINSFYKDPLCQMIWCAKGGDDSNSLFEYLDFDAIKKNPKIFCGFSDITSLNLVISNMCDCITFSGANFKTIFDDEYFLSLKYLMNRFENDSNLDLENAKYEILVPGTCEGKTIGGNLTLLTYLVCGKYKLDFEGKILFLEELGFEASPNVVNRNVNYLIQNNVFDKISGLVIGNYEALDGTLLEDIIISNLKLAGKLKFPIIKTNCFGHIKDINVIPIGAKAKIDNGLKLLENTLI